MSGIDSAWDKPRSVDMHPDLERCARHEWNEKFDRITWNHALSGPEWFNRKYFTGKDGYTRSEHSVARQQLGIDQPEVTDAEEEAWRAKERELIGKRNKYHREIKPGIWVDVYDVLQAWAVGNPALQHLIKKALQPGQRGHKDKSQDMDDIVASALRAKELESNKN